MGVIHSPGGCFVVTDPISAGRAIVPAEEIKATGRFQQSAIQPQKRTLFL